MKRRYRLYIIAFAIYTGSLLVTAVLAWLAIQYDIGAGVAQLAVSLTGNGLGGFAMVFGILQDDRAHKAEEKAAQAQQETAKAQKQAERAQKQAEQLQHQVEQQRQQAEQLQHQAEQQRQQAEQQRQRAERAEAELQRLLAERDNEVNARIRRLEIAAGLATPDASDDATEI